MGHWNLFGNDQGRKYNVQIWKLKARPQPCFVRVQSHVKSPLCVHHHTWASSPPNIQRYPIVTTRNAFKPPGGAFSSHTVESRTAVCRPRPGSVATKTAACGMARPGIAAEWPRAGWGPGSLTVSRPPRAVGASETARLTAAVMAAFAGSTSTVLGAVGAETAGSVGEGDCDTVSAGPSGRGAHGDFCSSSSVSVGVRAHSLRQPQSQSSVRPMMSSSQPLNAAAWDSGGGGDGGQRVGGEEADGEFLATAKAGGDDGSRFPGGDGSKRASKEEGGMLFSSVSDTVVQDGGFTTDGSMPAEGVFGEHSGDRGDEGVASGGQDKGGKIAGRDPPQQGKQRTCATTAFYMIYG